ncbi:MAG TPA: hypothetical protein VKS21_05305 [Spirochaetota bacterium]|nr:hypothetical protein [Spirochaetota bacterium]
MKKIKLNLILLLLMLSQALPETGASREKKVEELEKQVDYINSQKSFFIKGRGMFIADNSFLNGSDVLTNKAQKKHDNYIAVDLALEKSIFPYIKAHGALRFYSDFSGFFVQGETFQVRDVWIEATAFDFLDIRLGNFYQELSPLTMYLPADPLGYKSGIFNLLEEVKRYNVYQRDNAWYMQGGKLTGNLKIKEFRPLDYLGFYASVTPYGSLDFKKFITAFNLDTGRSNFYGLQYCFLDYVDRSDKYLNQNYSNYTADIIINSVAAFFDTTVLLEKMNQENKKPAMHGRVDTELAFSKYKGDTNGDWKGNALHLKVYYELFKNRLDFGFKSIDFAYYAPGAQSPSFYEELNSLSTYFKGQTNISGHFAERIYADDMAFNRIWARGTELIFPMGPATPNRQGISLAYANRMLSFLEAEINYDMYKEKTAAGKYATNGNSTGLRKFSGLQAGLALNLHKVHAMLPDIAYSFSRQKQTRNDANGNNNDNLTIKMHSCSLSWDPVEKLSLLAGLSIFNRSGFRHLEYNDALDPFMIQTVYYTGEMEETQLYAAAGAAYNINKNSRLVFYYDNKSEKGSYKQHGINGYLSVLF